MHPTPHLRMLRDDRKTQPCPRELPEWQGRHSPFPALGFPEQPSFHRTPTSFQKAQSSCEHQKPCVPLKLPTVPKHSLQSVPAGPSLPFPQGPQVIPGVPASKTPRSCPHSARWSPGCASGPPARARERSQRLRQPQPAPAGYAKPQVMGRGFTIPRGAND